MKINILVFPCGSEIALELYRSLRYSIHFNLIGANSIEDHGRFIYENYIGNLPFIDSEEFIPRVKQIVQEQNIHVIYPAMDSVMAILKNNENEIGCKIIGSCKETINICLSKSKSYEVLKDKIRVPKTYSLEDNFDFPIFAKPDIGYGSRGAKLLRNKKSLEEYVVEYPESILCEYLPGDEYTVDCFTDKNGKLRFWAPRHRKRVSNGISVNTVPIKDNLSEFQPIIEKINSIIKFRGAWFTQLKRDVNGKLCLLEIAARFGGSSSLFRNKGVNFAMLSLFDFLDSEIEIIENNYNIELDRSLDNIYKTDVEYNEVFIDFDDCIFLDNNLMNIEMISFLYQCLNKKIKISLITRHKRDIKQVLKEYKLLEIFDRIIHIKDKSLKSSYIDNKKSIFIDDSFAERKDVATQIGISVFSPDMIKCLLKH